VASAWSVAAILAPDAPVAEATTRTTTHAAVSAPQQVTPPPAGTEQPGAVGPPTGAAPPTEDGAPATTSERLLPEDEPSPLPVSTPVPVPPTGPVPCSNAMIAVTAEVGSPEHHVGERPLLRLAVTNTSEQPCVRDLDPARQEIVVWSGDGVDRLWSSNDCGNASNIDLRTLVPDQPVTFTLRWAGRTSTPGCVEERTVVPAGAYRVMARVDDVISPPTPFLRSG
jgi:hypothetical protein